MKTVGKNEILRVVKLTSLRNALIFYMFRVNIVYTVANKS